MAVEVLGSCVNQPIVRVLDGFLGPEAAAARDAVNRLEMTGEPVDMLVYATDGTPYELIGQPAGALIRLVLRDAHLLDDKLRDAEARVVAADTALNQHEWAQKTLIGLIDEAPIIAWNRTAAGEINWSAGEIRGRSGAVSADQAVDLIVARTKLNRQPVLAGQPQKSRIEIVVNDGAETVSLHVIEIVRQDSSRIGFATDAGTAASAERTLTRFVQTMTETFAHLTVGLAIFDRNQTLALFNPALVQMWQVEPAWLARRPSLRDIIDELRATRRLPELQDFHKWRTRLIELFENTEAADYEELWHLADGSNIRVLARPHPHGSLAFIFDDVTERMRLEQRYRHSIDLLRRATLDRLTEGIAVFGANGLLQFVNQAFHEIWGTDSETVYAAMHARQLVTLCEEMTMEPEVWHRLHGYITGEENRRAWTARLTMGSHRVLTARFAPLPDGSTMAVFADITDSERIAIALNERTEALEMADAMRSAVLEQLSGKLQAPLTAALSKVHKLEEMEGLSEEAKSSVAQIALEAQNVMNVMTDVTDMAAHPIGPSDGEDTNATLSEILTVTQHVLMQRAVAARIDLQLEADLDEISEIRCDNTRLRLIAFSLAAESIQNAADGGTVSLGGQVDGERFRLHTVTDLAERSLGDHEKLRFPTPLIYRLVGSIGGAVSIEMQPDDKVRIVCEFGPRLLIDDLGDTSGVTGSDEGKIHPLVPNAS